MHFFPPIIIFISIAHIPFAEITSRYAQKHCKVGFLDEISAAPRYNCMLLIWHQTTWNNKCNLSFSFELHFTKECHEKHSASENAEPLECVRWGKAESFLKHNLKTRQFNMLCLKRRRHHKENIHPTPVYVRSILERFARKEKRNQNTRCSLWRLFFKLKSTVHDYTPLHHTVSDSLMFIN